MELTTAQIMTMKKTVVKIVICREIITTIMIQSIFTSRDISNVEKEKFLSKQPKYVTGKLTVWKEVMKFIALILLSVLHIVFVLVHSLFDVHFLNYNHFYPISLLISLSTSNGIDLFKFYHSHKNTTSISILLSLAIHLSSLLAL